MLNKVIGIPLLPTKLVLAAWMARQWEDVKRNQPYLNLWQTTAEEENHNLEDDQDS